MFNKVFKNKYGFHQLTNIPDLKELREYYTHQYYQDSIGGSKSSYLPEELQYKNNKLEQKYQVLLNYLGTTSESQKSFLDIGCGEGWALKFFYEKQWDVLGLDYGDFGCLNHNPDYREYLITGDIYASIYRLIETNKHFDCIWVDNVLEHIIDPYKLVTECRKLVTEHGIMVIEVPNDFSIVQEHLNKNGYVSKQFWINEPEHISYFNREGLISVCQEAGWNCLYTMGDFPIEFNLFNENTNYVGDKSIGKSCHQARIAIENFLHSISIEKTNELYHVLSMMGVGRQIIGFFVIGDK